MPPEVDDGSLEPALCSPSEFDCCEVLSDEAEFAFAGWLAVPDWPDWPLPWLPELDA